MKEYRLEDRAETNKPKEVNVKLAPTDKNYYKNKDVYDYLNRGNYIERDDDTHHVIVRDYK
jgi:hypothetical protein